MMRTSTLMTALLLSLSCISVSGSQTVAGQPGEDVTLVCSNISRIITHTFWSRLSNTNNISCISSMYGSNDDAALCDRVQHGKFHMSSNVSFIFLQIRQVDVTDSGLYLCGFYMHGHTMMDVIHLSVEDGPHDVGCTLVHDGQPRLMSVILGGVAAIFLIIIIVVLAGKNVRLHKGTSQSSCVCLHHVNSSCFTVILFSLPALYEKQHPHKHKNLDSDDLKVPAVSGYSAVRSRRPASDREVETHVVYNSRSCSWSYSSE
ncbi:uncharacterized protein LOC114450999 isoform X2 [Parambassis ranga]|uniref:Uncharacterized protein LOC114450999 isoform X2 n=1 Tax=Parambassis ranga TaxID=210632 RepID=A0A6P7K791_9TELE|nr:uncharacterized protein LOC114450999 isoform X2 [Parambassis ranga]